MPQKPKSPCTYDPTCPNLVDKPGPCPDCRRKIEARRGTASQRGYGARWRERRAAYLAAHPKCNEEGCNRKATEVDHEPPRRELVAAGVEDPDADQYLNAKCKSHHSKKTARQNQFGGRRR